MQKNKINKSLFIIHNLSTYTSINQVEDYLKNFLLNSATFVLEEGHYISTIEKGKINGKYYNEKTESPKIYHLIFANQDSEAGEHYNKFALSFIENSYQDIINLQPFDVIQTIKERFIELSKDFIDNTKNTIDKKDFENLNEKDEKIIKLNKDQEITLKRCLIDELGFSNLKTNGFEPTYNYFKKDNTIEIRVEASGNCSINSNLHYEGIYTVIKINGEKKQDKEPKQLGDNLYNTREFGKFSLEIPLKTEDYLIKNEKPQIKQIGGILILVFQLDTKEEGENFETKFEI